MPAKTPETIVKDRFKAMMAKICALRGIIAKLTYNAGAAYGTTTLDVTGVIAGWPVVVELKRFDGKGKLTGRQRLDLNEFAAAGSLTWVIDTEDKFNVFFGWVALVQPAAPPALKWDNYK